MRRFITLLAVLAVPWCAPPARAQIVVQKGGGQKSSMDFSGFQAAGDEAAQNFAKTLQSDLLRSGWFAQATPGQGEFRLSGSGAGDGSGLRAECRVFGAGTQRQVFGKAYRAPAKDVRRLAHQAADDIVEALTGQRGFASARLAMVGSRSGHKEIYVCDADGHGLVQLTSDRSVSIAPNWGPGGRKIAYTAYLKGFPDVYLVDLASGGRTRVAGYSGLNTGAAISPSGREMALILSKDGNPELYVKNLQSGALTRLTSTKRYAEASPSWSPDGSRIVYVSDQSGKPQLYIIGRDGGAGQRVTSRGSENVAPDWGPGGLIAYASKVGGNFHVCVLDPATLEAKQISSGGADYEDPSWAPDKRHIACARSVQYKSQVYLLDTQGDPPIVLTDYSGDWYSPAWAPAE
jgi:TolB protein